tara:strand:- start:2639 stop:3760 length:1122 start_codon:yes stop_codon:yes gene_type:complete
MKKYDVVIVGAGCSGLSLAYRLIQSSMRVCLLDNMTRKNRHRKTWSYWNTYKHPFEHLQIKSNKTLIVKNEYETVLDCSEYTYSTLDSYDFDDYIFSKIDTSSNIDLLFESSIEDIELGDHSSKLIMSGGQTINCNYIFDSRPNKSLSGMKQVFKGLFVKFEENPRNFYPHLMDFSDKNQFHFFYSLPLSDRNYLFESTYYTFSKMDKQEMTDEVHTYIQNKYGKNYKVIREEYGEIPLTTSLSLNNKNSKYIKIGIPAGSTRASTGYTFLNIQKQSDEYVKMLNGQNYIEHPRTFKNQILRKMDNLLLMIIKDNPRDSMSILYKMFMYNDNNRIIRFLSDTPTVIDILSIIWNMPKLLFIKYAIKSITSSKI